MPGASRAGSRSCPTAPSPRRFFLPSAGSCSPREQRPAIRSGCAIREAKEHSDCIVASSDRRADRNAAEALRGARVFVPRSSFPTAGEDEYYWVDLIGLAVVNREGVALGTVRELLDTGPQTVLVLATDDDGKPVERLIPFVSAYVDKVDLPGRRIIVDWQPDY